MIFRVEIQPRAIRDLRGIYEYINAENSRLAHVWFNGLEAAIASLDRNPLRCPITPENGRLRHLLYGKRPRVYRIIFAVDERGGVVSIVHIRHGARAAPNSRV
jgi:plasmid stabilization system protein ParE